MQNPSISYGKTVIYYFSGTGNAKQVAHWLSASSKKHNIDPKVINIANNHTASPQEIEGNTLIGFCYPTHGFNAPPNILKFIIGFPRSENHQHFFVANTRAGMKINKVFMPGLSGIALLLPALILMFKGYRLHGYRSIDLPSNWISLHPGLRKKVIDSIFKRCDRIVNKFGNRIFSGKKSLRSLWWLPIDIMLIPISIGYYFFGRYALSKTFIATNKCTNCGLCIEKCPVKAIAIIDGKPFWKHNCESCMKCMNHCPERAIETPHGFTAVIWWFCFVMLPVLITNLINKLLTFNHLTAEIVIKIVFITACFIIIFSTYRIMHKLMKFKFFNNIIQYTSLTYFKCWRRYKAPKYDL